MAFAEAIEKIARNEPLTPQELQTLRDEAKAIEEIKNLVKSWVIPGSSTPFIQNLQASNIFVPSGEIRLGEPAPGQGFDGVRIAKPAFEYDGELWNIAGVEDDTLQVGIRASDGRLVAGGGNVVLGADGIDIIGEGSSWINFFNADGSVVLFNMSVDSVLGQFQFQATQPGDSLSFFIVTTDENSPTLVLGEDGGQANRAQLNLSTGAQGGKISIDNRIMMIGQGDSGGKTYLAVAPSASTPPTPADTGDGVPFHAYIKSNKFILQYEDSGTVRYKYLDLTGTGTTWTHTTSAP